MSLWSGSLALFVVLKVPCAPLPEQPPAASTLPENHDQLTPPGFSGATLSLLPVLSYDCPQGLLFIWLSWSSSSSVPPRKPCTPSSLPLAPQLWVSALEVFSGGSRVPWPLTASFYSLGCVFQILSTLSLPLPQDESHPTPCGPSWVLCYSIIDIYSTRLCWLLHKIHHPWCWGF